MVSRYGVATALNAQTSTMAAASVGNFALFGGGYTKTDEYVDTVYAYDSSLTKKIAPSRSKKGSELAGASVDGYALLAGGYYYSSGHYYLSNVDAYDASLTKITAMALSKGRKSLCSANTNGYALFAGGYTGSAYSAVVDVYDASLTRTTAATLSQARDRIGGASVSGYALFAGGFWYSSGTQRTKNVDVYSASLVKSIVSLKEEKHYTGAASIKGYAIFAGGSLKSGKTDAVEIFDASLSRSEADPLSVSRYALMGVSVEDNAIFAGGSGDGTVATVDYYDSSLVRTTGEDLAEPREQSNSAAAVGCYALFAGGFWYNKQRYSDIVDVYQVK